MARPKCWHWPREDFSYEELTTALKYLRHGNVPGPDNIHAEFLIHAGDHAQEWLRKFFNKCLLTCKLPRIWRRATVVAILKPKKPKDESKSYRPISLLCIPYKIVERRGTPHLQLHLPRDRPTTTTGASRIPPWPVNSRPSGKTSQRHWTCVRRKPQGWCCICWYDCSLWHCMAPRHHAETASDATGPTHGALHFRAHLKSQRCRENQRWSTKQTAETHQQWRPTRICSVAPALQRLHSRLTTNQLEKVRICRQPCLAQSSPRLEHDWRDIKPGYVHPVNLAKTVEAQINLLGTKFLGNCMGYHGRVIIEGCRTKCVIDKYTNIFIFWSSIDIPLWWHMHDYCMNSTKIIKK